MKKYNTNYHKKQKEIIKGIMNKWKTQNKEMNTCKKN